MAKKNYNLTIDNLLDKVKEYDDNKKHLDMIRKAYEYANSKHFNQKRITGDDYIQHPLNVALILTNINSDYKAICAALLHDTIEDSDGTYEEISKLFDKEVANLVECVTKINRISFTSESEQMAANQRKILVGLAEDVRVIIIKLADRLHNMRTLYVMPLEKQKKKAKETLEILTPVAHRLGIYKIKSELEDLSLRYSKPEAYYDIVEKLNLKKTERDKAVGEMLSEVSKLLDEHNIKHEIKGRSKSIYSIYKKLEKGRKFSDIYDLLALRVLVDTEQECYQALGIIHSKYRPIPKRFKDYVAMPKPNGYQSLHTTVFGIDGYLFEIQIRTHEMDEIAENGVASHWAYKEHKTLTEGIRTSTEAKLQFFKSIIELNEEKMSSEDFVNSVKNEILNNNIYVFTPKGDIFELPKGSTPIDFAYRVHTRVGETTVGAIVNNNMVPLNSELKNNDIVKIITNKNSPGPSKEWLNIVASTQAKNKIKAFFTKSERDRYIERGKDSLEKEMRKQKIVFSEFLSEENLNILLSELKLIDLDELYLSIGNGKFSASYVVNLLNKKEQPKEEVKIKHPVATIDNNIIVEGIDKVRVNIANCCSPIPGDEIVGYITKGNGISVHRKSCHNLEFLDSRMINVKWNNTTSGKFLTSLIVYSETSDKAMMDITQKAIPLGVNIDSIKTINRMDGITFQIDIYVENLTKLSKFMNDISNIKYIKNVVRVIKWEYLYKGHYHHRLQLIMK